jgi:hypothetical protein
MLLPCRIIETNIEANDTVGKAAIRKAEREEIFPGHGIGRIFPVKSKGATSITRQLFS